MLRNESASKDVRNILRKAIQSGVYHAGETLPSSRDLAEQFGINRNTANKIYQELAAEGLVEPSPNRPPKVIVPTGTAHAPDLRQHVRSSLWPLLHEGRILGVPESLMRETIRQQVDDFFETVTPPRIFVTECNTTDVERYADELTAVLGCTVRPVLLDQLNDKAEGADIVVAPHFHLAEAREALGNARDLALGVLLTPDATDVAEVISRVDRGPVGLIGGNPASVERLRSLLRFYVDFPTMTATIDDAEGIARIIDSAEHIVCTARFRPNMERSGIGGKTLAMHYHVDPVSIEVLRLRMLSAPERSSLAAAGD